MTVIHDGPACCFGEICHVDSMSTPTTVSYTHRIRVYPNAAQRAMLQRWFGATRWAWNHSLERRTKAYRRRGESVTGTDVSRAITGLKQTNRYAWLGAVPATLIVQKLRDQDRAFSNFFAGRAQYPRFRRRGHNESVRVQLDQRANRPRARWEAGEIVLPGLGALKYRGRHPRQYPKMATIRRDAAGRYFVTAMVEVTPAPRPDATQTVGVDLGLKDLAVLSTGEKVPNPRPLRVAQRRLKRAQRRLARKRRGSNRWQAQRRCVAKQHAHVTDTRNDTLHKLSRRLVDENQVLCVESLNVRGIARSKLAASAHDAAWGELLRQINYKAEWAGRTVVAIDRFAPSTKMCSECETVNKKLTLADRAWLCPDCGVHHDRDINAAVNIRRWGVTQLLPGGTGDVMRVEGDTHRGAERQHRSVIPASAEARTGQTAPACSEQVGAG